MICKTCKQAFNGSTGICPECGTKVAPLFPPAKKLKSALPKKIKKEVTNKKVEGEIT